jgi:cytochrome c
MNTTRRSRAAKLVLGSFALTSLLLTPVVRAATSDANATQLLAKYNCQACHTVDKKLVGPAYEEVAAKYKGDAAAPAKLEQKIKNGGSGVWGAIPMPPNNVPDADLKTLVEWILAQK